MCVNLDGIAGREAMGAVNVACRAGIVGQGGQWGSMRMDHACLAFDVLFRMVSRLDLDCC